ncbi:uncharacterized protein At4g26450 [Magnolia sinica]|uniref:uncharacterized protein At4g26450 n=1 Tax=Magnolia sinica TaxID=86752 RepID=UPI002658FCF4|nr:uncharacterized protein At4g26450 [Magnolia sinica]
MHARHRSPGDGVRSTSVGMYNSEYRSFNRGFGRGPPKAYPPPPPPPPLPPRRVGDIFMEAGRLAAEYLVSQGALPPSSLPGKWQNGSNVQEFRAQDREHLPIPPEGRNLSFGRFGNVGPEGGSGRRRFPDEFNSMGPRSRMRGRRRNGHLRGYGSDWNRENGRSGPWSEQARGFPDIVEGEDDFAGGYHRDPKVSFDFVGGAPKYFAYEQSSKDEMSIDYESELETYEFPNDAGSKASSSSTLKELPPETDANLNKAADDAIGISLDTGEVKDIKHEEEMEKETVQEKLDKQDCSVEDDPVSKHGSDLLQLCNFTKVPTKTRSSLTSKALKVDQSPTTEERSASDVAPAMYKIPEEEVSIDGSKSDLLTNPIHISDNLASDDISEVPSVQSVDEAPNLEPASVVEREISPRPRSFSDTPFTNQEESSDCPPGFDICKPVVASNEDESSVQHETMREATKRPREWPPSGALQDDEYFHLHNSKAKQSCTQFEGLSPDVVMVEADDQETVVEGASSPKARAESGIESREEKQFPSSSFKICDLNLTDASEITENPHDLVQDHVSADVADLGVEKEALVDVGLSISNSFKNTSDYDGCSSDAKEVAVIDVPDDPVIEDRVFGTSEQKTETIYSSIESFLNHTENAVDLPDVQDGYGHAISEFLGADISNCSSVPNGITDLQTEMTLHNQEGMLADDDQIYLTLGEIPISFLGVWDQPPQEYGKPF